MSRDVKRSQRISTDMNMDQLMSTAEVQAHRREPPPQGTPRQEPLRRGLFQLAELGWEECHKRSGQMGCMGETREVLIDRSKAMSRDVKGSYKVCQLVNLTSKEISTDLNRYQNVSERYLSLALVGRYQQTLNGSFSAVSMPIFASKYSLEKGC